MRPSRRIRSTPLSQTSRAEPGTRDRTPTSTTKRTRRGRSGSCRGSSDSRCSSGGPTTSQSGSSVRRCAGATNWRTSRMRRLRRRYRCGPRWRGTPRRSATAGRSARRSSRGSGWSPPSSRMPRGRAKSPRCQVPTRSASPLRRYTCPSVSTCHTRRSLECTGRVATARAGSGSETRWTS